MMTAMLASIKAAAKAIATFAILTYRQKDEYIKFPA